MMATAGLTDGNLVKVARLCAAGDLKRFCEEGEALQLLGSWEQVRRSPHVSSDGVIWALFLNRPHTRNAVNRSLSVELSLALEAFEDSSSARIAVLCGISESFCAGADLKAVASVSSSSDTSEALLLNPVDDALLNRGPLGPSRMVLSKPLIAAVDGPAVAGGLELSLLADLRVATRRAYFGVFCRRFGVPLIDGGMFNQEVAEEDDSSINSLLCVCCVSEIRNGSIAKDCRIRTSDGHDLDGQTGGCSRSIDLRACQPGGGVAGAVASLRT